MRAPVPYDVTERLSEQAEALDPVAEAVSSAVRSALGAAPPVRDALSGTWLGHALHPLLQLGPLGTWLSAVLLDYAGDEDSADLLVRAGVLAAVPTIASGWTDYSFTSARDDVRRIGIVHAAANATGTALFAASWAARRNGARGRGKALALVGLTAVAAGGYLGGHLSYAAGVGVDETTFDALPSDWVRVADDAAVTEGAMIAVPAGEIKVLLTRRAGRVYALDDRCCHRSGPLHEGELRDGCVVCPLHGSTFRLEDGSVVTGPAPYPQPALETRLVDGGIEVRSARSAA